jgi:triosephosphate isomerase (TIM)
MSARRPLIVGNWKMNTTLDEARTLARGIVSAVNDVSDVDMVVLPPYPWLIPVAETLQGSKVAIGAQNMHPDAGGAYTGEVSFKMLKGLCRYVLVGQYERRIFFAEKDAIVRRKLQVGQQNGFLPILCVGENADQLDEGLGPYIVAEQLEAALDGGARLDSSLIIAYDPVWTTMGLVAPPPPHYAGEIVGHIRSTLSSLFTPGLGDEVRVIYGGSVTVRNLEEIAALEGLDGVLAHTSALNPQTFASIARAFVSRTV